VVVGNIDSKKSNKMEKETKQVSRLETVELDHLLVNATLLDKEIQDLGALIALELNDRSELGILNKRSIAGKILLENLQHALLVKGCGESLDGRQGLASVTLLNADIC
jgi:hypothetical protein